MSTARPAVAGIGVLFAAVISGTGFGGTFGVWPLVAPVLAAVLGVAVADLLASRCLASRPFVAGLLRAPLGLLLGGAAALGTYVLGAAATVGEVLRGATTGWLRTLESTLPARPEPGLTAFVVLLVLMAAVLGIEWLRRGLAPLATLLPALAVLVLGQLFAVSDGWQPMALAAGFGLAVALVLSDGRTALGGGWRAVWDVVAVAGPVALVATLGAVAFAALPAGETFSVHDDVDLADVPSSAVSPLDEIGGRLTEPGRAVFTVRTDAPVDRWPTAVLDGFDGAGWTSSAQYRPLGAELAAQDGITVPTRSATADVELAPATTSPWLPTRFRVRSVDGVSPSVDPGTGVLLLAGPQPGATYRFAWQEPDPEQGRLAGAAVDLTVDGAVSAGTALEGLDDLVTAAAGGASAAAPTFDTALRIEQWFRENYRRSPEGSPATGNGTRQLRRFLEDTRTGTSEQFAAAYVLVAAEAGLPTRLVVGFRNPGLADADGRVVVHNSDVLAWPEVAVVGVGWVALDPTGDATSNPTGGNGLAEAVDDARTDLPPEAGAPEPQPVPQPSPAESASVVPGGGNGASLWWTVLVAAAVVAGTLLLALLAVPVTKLVRRSRRRRAPGAAAVLGAWLDTRDVLRDHGVSTSPGHTARDLAHPATPLLGNGVEQLERLARSVDAACWAAAGPPDPGLADVAWDAAVQVRRTLARRPLPDRLRTAVRVRSLTGPRS